MREITVTIPAQEITMEVPEDINSFVRALDLLKQGKTIQAIKEIRDSSDMTLFDAKRYIDSLNATASIRMIEQLRETSPEYFL